MRAVIQSFAIFMNLSILLLEMFQIARRVKSMKTIKSRQMPYQILFTFSILLLFIYQYKALFIAYNNPWDFNYFDQSSGMKLLLYFSDCIFKTCLIVTFQIILISIKNMNLSPMIDVSFTNCVLLYGILRLIPFFILTLNLYAEPFLFTLAMEIILISEVVFLFIVLLIILDQTRVISRNLVNSDITNSILIEIQNNTNFVVSKKIVYGIILEIANRFISVLVNPKTTNILVYLLIDFSNLLRMISLIYYILGMNELLFEEDYHSQTTLENTQTKTNGEKFFLFQDTTETAEVAELR